MSLMNNIRDMLKHGSIYFFGLGLNIIFQIALLPVFTRFLTTGDYGVIAVLESAIELVKIICTMGISDSIVMFYHDKDSKYGYQPRHHQWRAKYGFTSISTGIISLFVISALCGTFLWVFNENITTFILGDEKFAPLFLMTVARVLLAVMRSGIDSYFIVQKKSKYFVYANTGQVFFNSITNLVLVVYFNLGVYGFVLGNLVTGAVFNIFLLVWVLSKIEIKFDTQLALKMLKFSSPLAVSVLCVAGIHNLDRFFLRSFLSLEAVGLYSLAYRFPFQLYTLFAMSFSRIFKGATIYSIAKADDSSYQFAKITTYYMLVTGYVLYCLCIFSHLILKILAAPEYINAYRYLPVISIGVWIYGLHGCISYVVFLTKKSYLFLINNLIALSVNIITNILFIPIFGIMGAAFSTTLTYTCYSVLAVFIFNKKYPVKVESKKLLIFFTLGAVLTFLRFQFGYQGMLAELSLNFLFIIMFSYFIFKFPMLLTSKEREYLSSSLQKYSNFRKLPVTN